MKEREGHDTKSDVNGGFPNSTVVAVDCSVYSVVPISHTLCAQSSFSNRENPYHTQQMRGRESINPLQATHSKLLSQPARASPEGTA